MAARNGYAKYLWVAILGAPLMAQSATPESRALTPSGHAAHTTQTLFRHALGYSVARDERPWLHADVRKEEDEVAALRRGVRLDWAADSGHLFFAVQRARDRGRRCTRWTLNTDGAAPEAGLWSLGVAVDYVRVPDSNQRQLVWVPQLNVDLSRWLDAPGSMTARVQHAHWRSPEGRPQTADQAVQVSLQWNY